MAQASVRRHHGRFFHTSVARELQVHFLVPWWPTRYVLASWSVPEKGGLVDSFYAYSI